MLGPSLIAGGKSDGIETLLAMLSSQGNHESPIMCPSGKRTGIYRFTGSNWVSCCAIPFCSNIALIRLLPMIWLDMKL